MPGRGVSACATSMAERGVNFSDVALGFWVEVGPVEVGPVAVRAAVALFGFGSGVEAVCCELAAESGFSVVAWVWPEAEPWPEAASGSSTEEPATALPSGPKGT